MWQALNVEQEKYFDTCIFNVMCEVQTSQLLNASILCTWRQSLSFMLDTTIKCLHAIFRRR